jgi:hypothetical protein
MSHYHDGFIIFSAFIAQVFESLAEDGETKINELIIAAFLIIYCPLNLPQKQHFLFALIHNSYKLKLTAFLKRDFWKSCRVEKSEQVWKMMNKKKSYFAGRDYSFWILWLSILFCPVKRVVWFYFIKLYSDAGQLVAMCLFTMRSFLNVWCYLGVRDRVFRRSRF